MKQLLTMLLLLCMVTTGHADEKRTYTKINSSEAKVVIETQEHEGIQAAAYIDAKENERFIQDLMKDKNSKLYNLKLQIEKENCNQSTMPGKNKIDGCGEVTLTKEVRTSFGRGGWSSGGSSYTFFIGFTNEGSGRFFDVSHMVTISEAVEAQIKKNGEYAGSIIKTLEMGKITRIDEDNPIVK